MADRSYKLTLSLSDGSTINAGTITAPQGPNGANGVTFTPSVSAAGVLSWTNNGGLTNPSPISIKGPKGDDAIITASDVENWGFTKNTGTITEIRMNGVSKGKSGVVDLGTVLTDESKFATSAQGTNADSALSKANTNATEISTIKTTYQTKTDTTLETTSKTVVGAINEVKGTADNAVQSFEAEATIDDTTGTPTVEIVKSGEGTAPTYTFNFKHLKGADGRQGEAGLVYTKLYSSVINPDVVGSQTITIPTSDFNRIPKTNETFILFNQYGYYLESTVSSITVENNIQVAKCLIVPSKAVNINGTNGADGEEALVCTVMSSLAFEPSTEIGFSLNSFNRTPKPREKFIAFSLECQYATFSVNRVTAQFAYCMTSYVVSTKGQDGAQGATGKDALVYCVLEDTILKKDKTIGLFYEDKLNRIPVVNDTLLIVGSGNQYCIGTVTRVNTTTKACDIQCGTVVSTKGETGPQGVSITNATAGASTVADGKTTTPITFSLSDGTTKEVNVEAQNGIDGTSATVTIVQATGQSTTAVMSQKAVTDELNKKATTSEVNAKYTKPSDGIPKSDLAEDVQTSLEKADTALQSAPVTSVNGKTGAVQLGASDVNALSLDGGTINKSKTIKMDASANSDGANLKWGTVNSKNPYIGYASDQVDGTFVVGSLLGTNYASGLAIGGGSGNLLWKGTKVATTSDIPTNYVTTDTTQTISGAKTFTSDVVVNKATPKFNMKLSGLTNGTTPSDNQFGELCFLDKNGVYEGGIRFDSPTNGENRTKLSTNSFGTTYSNYVGLFAKKNASSATATDIWRFIPNQDAVIDLGQSDLRWRNVRAVTTYSNVYGSDLCSTSSLRLKDPNITRGTNQAASGGKQNYYRAININDKNNKKGVGVEWGYLCEKNSNGDTTKHVSELNLLVYPPNTTNNANFVKVALGKRSDGTTYFTYAGDQVITTKNFSLSGTTLTITM